MPRYPHLLPADAILWQLFLNQHAGEYRLFEYDVKVGHGNDPGEEYPPPIRFDAITLSQRRIDAVGYQAKVITIFEVTCNAGLTALGQLMAYPQLFRETYSPDLPLRPWLVAYSFQTDIQRLFDAQGINYTLLERAAEPSTPGSES